MQNGVGNKNLRETKGPKQIKFMHHRIKILLPQKFITKPVPKKEENVETEERPIEVSNDCANKEGSEQMRNNTKNISSKKKKQKY